MIKNKNPEAELQGLTYFGRTITTNCMIILSDPIIFSAQKSKSNANQKR